MTKILLADDDPVIQHLLGATLKQAGYEVESASSGQECLNKLEQLSPPPEVLLLDVQLGDMTGEAVLQKVKSTDSLSEIKILILSANSEEEILKLQPDAKLADGFLEKPFELHEAKEAIEKVLGN